MEYYICISRGNLYFCYIIILNRHYMKRLLSVLGVILMLSCESSKKPDETAFLDSLDNMETQEPMISEEVISDIIQQIPSPLEISVLLKEAGTKYDKDLLNDAENTVKYNTNFQKALNLGVYGTDLGYTNIYERNQDAVFYLNSIKELADDLSIGQFFDFGTIKRLATNSKNLDSLLLITTKNFNNINSYLQEQQRSNLSILLLTGGWIEALHITCEVYERNPTSQALRDRIGEQKIILENIMLLLSFYSSSDPNIADLMADLNKLQETFGEIEIKYTYRESTFEEVNGVLMIKDNSTTEIMITDENIDKISSVTNEIRKNVIS